MSLRRVFWIWDSDSTTDHINKAPTVTTGAANPAFGMRRASKIRNLYKLWKQTYTDVFTESHRMKPNQVTANQIEPQRLDSNQIDQHWKSLDPNKWNCIDPSLVASNQSKPPHIESDHIESHQTEMNPLHLHEHKSNRSPPRQIESNHYRAKHNHWIKSK